MVYVELMWFGVLSNLLVTSSQLLELQDKFEQQMLVDGLFSLWFLLAQIRELERTSW